MVTKLSALAKITELVERFEEQYVSYLKADYNETQTRRDFIDPFFKALGWDIDNEQGHAEAYREVIHEDRVKIGKATKAPDYSFKLAGGKRLFFVEAKKPSIQIKNDTVPAYQVRRYGWNAKLAISIVTDFEEFAVYDCTKKPKPSDKAGIARTEYFTFRDYIEKFDFLWDTFSKEKVLKGSFDKYVESNVSKKGTISVDKDFLISLDNWRTYLATSISLKNKNLNEDEINFAVQQTLDRIVFLRIAEARGIEDDGNLKEALQKGDSYQNLFEVFKKADAKYNSGLFDLRKDQISSDLKIDNKVIKSIVTELYYPESPYEFSILAVEILGSAYEQFLGKQIKVDSYHRAVIEEKPEVRKAGGVYYTPQYIVDYIVENTVGNLVKGKTPKEVSEIKIVDPACGSGSFLLGAYGYLLNWYKGHYLPEFERLTKIISEQKTNTFGRDAEKVRKKLPLTPSGDLTTALKKQILINNIYGVDLDINAVEVTKLSLLIKCMEGETSASITREAEFGQRALPTLDNNIKSGNSLIDIDYYDGQIDFGDERKIKPFNWQRAFPSVFNIQIPKETNKLSSLRRSAAIVAEAQKDLDNKMDNYLQSLEEPPVGYGNINGGFDAVIGNPPYVRQELLGEQKVYFQNHYRVYHGMADLYSYFIEKSIKLLKPNGLYGVIVANKWMRANYGEPLRKYLKEKSIFEIIDFGDLPVFESATTYPCIIIAGNEDKKNVKFKLTQAKTLQFHSLSDYVLEHTKSVTKKSLDDSGWNLAGEAEQNLLKKIEKAGIPLGEYVNGKIYRGVLTGLNEAFVIDKTTRDRLIKEDKKSAEIIKPFLAGRDIKRYQTPKSERFLIFARRGIEIEKYPVVLKHLERFKEQLLPKPKDFKGDKWPGRKPGSYKWYELQDAVDYYEEFEKPKIIYPNILSKPEFVFDDKYWYANQKCFIISLDDKYLLGILNSKLMHYWFEKYLPKLRGGFYEPSYIFFKNFPVIKIDKYNKVQDEIKRDIINLVEIAIKFKQEIVETKLSDKIDSLSHKIELTEERINGHVAKLYGFTEEEIAIINSV